MYLPTVCPHKFLIGFNFFILLSISTSYDSITSCITLPISPILTSIPASFIPAFVAYFVAKSKLSYFGLNATENAQSITKPLT